jgi:hypothetical protein
VKGIEVPSQVTAVAPKKLFPIIVTGVPPAVVPDMGATLRAVVWPLFEHEYETVSEVLALFNTVIVVKSLFVIVNVLKALVSVTVPVLPPDMVAVNVAGPGPPKGLTVIVMTSPELNNKPLARVPVLPAPTFVIVVAALQPALAA